MAQGTNIYIWDQKGGMWLILGNTVIRNDLIQPASFLNACNNKPHHKGVSPTTVNSGFVPG